jgi:hypothetical protein
MFIFETKQYRFTIQGGSQMFRFIHKGSTDIKGFENQSYAKMNLGHMHDNKR